MTPAGTSITTGSVLLRIVSRNKPCSSVGVVERAPRIPKLSALATATADRLLHHAQV
jgi:hypothetical protein